MTLRELSALADLKDGTLTHWKTSTPKADSLYRVASVLGVSVEYLLTGEKTPVSDAGDGRAVEFEKAVNLLFADQPEGISRLLDALAADPEKTKAKFDLFLATL